MPHHISISTFLTSNFDETPVKLSDISDNISFIQLETSEEILISNIRHIEMSDSCIFILDNNKLSRFSMNGKFINIIGKTGKGPGEISKISTFSIDKNNKNIYVLDNTFKIAVFNYDGSFAGKEFRNTGTNSFIFNNNHLYCSQPQVLLKYLDNLKYKISIINCSNNEVINLLPMAEPSLFIDSRFITFSNFYMFGEHIYFNDPLDDTVYIFKEIFSMSPKYIFIKDNSVDKGITEVKKIIETENNLFIHTLNISNWNLVIYNKKYKISKLQQKKNNEIGFQDDVYNLSFFLPRFINDSILFDIIYPFELKDNNMFNVKEDDNPIIRICKLKSEVII